MLRVLTQDMATGSGNYNEGQNMGEAVLMVGFPFSQECAVVEGFKGNLPMTGGGVV